MIVHGRHFMENGSSNSWTLHLLFHKFYLSNIFRAPVYTIRNLRKNCKRNSFKRFHQIYQRFMVTVVNVMVSNRIVSRQLVILRFRLWLNRRTTYWPQSFCRTLFSSTCKWTTRRRYKGWLSMTVGVHFTDMQCCALNSRTFFWCPLFGENAPKTAISAIVPI